MGFDAEIGAACVDNDFGFTVILMVVFFVSEGVVARGVVESGAGAGVGAGVGSLSLSRYRL